MGMQMSRSGGGTAAMGFGGLLLVTLFWCGITGMFAGFVGVTAYRVADANTRFLAVEGTVTASRIATSRGSKGGTNYKPVVEYRYTVAGREYQADRYEFMGMSSSSGHASSQAVVTAHAPGKTVTVYYDPQAPESAVLRREFPDMLVFMTLFLQPFLLIGLGMMLATVTAGRDAMRGRSFRNGGARRPPWPVPGWGVLRQEPGGAFVLRGGGRVAAAAGAFAVGYGLTCFGCVFVVAFGFLMALQGKYGVATPALAGLVLALMVGAVVAQRTWRKGDPKVTFTFHPTRGKITLTGGGHQEPVSLRLDETAGFLVRREWRTRKSKNGSTRQELFLPKLVTVEGQELALTEFTKREDADHLAAEFAELTGKPVEAVVEEETAGDEPGMPQPKNLGEVLSFVRTQWKKRQEK